MFTGKQRTVYKENDTGIVFQRNRYFPNNYITSGLSVKIYIVKVTKQIYVKHMNKTGARLELKFETSSGHVDIAGPGTIPVSLSEQYSDFTRTIDTTDTRHTLQIQDPEKKDRFLLI